MKRLALVLVALLCLPSVARAQSYTLSPPPFLLAQTNAGAVINNACIWTYAAGTTTVATTYSDNIGTVNTNPIRSDPAGRFVAFLAPGVGYKFVYETACVPPAHGTVLKTSDGISGVPNSSSNAEVVGTAGEALTLGTVVYLSDGQGARTAGRWYTASSTQPYTSNGVSLGMVSSAAAGVASPVTVRLVGLSGNVSGLTPGTVYYLNTTGGLTTLTGTSTGTRRVVGTAQTATTIVLGTPGEAFATTKVLNQSVNVTVSNTVTPTAIYTYSVPAGTLGIDRSLRLTVVGDYGNTSGGNSNLNVDITFGGQTIATGLLSTFATASSGPFGFDIWISAAGTMFQKALAMFSYSKSATTTWGNQTLGLSSLNGSMTVDSTAAQSVTVTITHSVANAAIHLTMYTATLELIGQ